MMAGMTCWFQTRKPHGRQATRLGQFWRTHADRILKSGTSYAAQKKPERVPVFFLIMSSLPEIALKQHCLSAISPEYT
jgi:hypothetical protein